MAGIPKTSFKSYVLCDICKISHNLHIKHLYSRRHTQRVEEILKKSVGKVSLAKSKGTMIEIHDEEWQKEEKFWCWFCSDEFLKHFPHNSVMVCCLGLINHLAGQDHYEAVKKFLAANRRNSDSVEKFILKKSELTSFLDRLPEAEAQYLKKMDHLHHKDVDHVRNADRQRQELVNAVTFQTFLNSLWFEHDATRSFSKSFVISLLAMKGRQFKDVDIKRAVMQQLSSIMDEVFQSCFQALQHCWNHCRRRLLLRHNIYATDSPGCSSQAIFSSFPQTAPAVAGLSSWPSHLHFSQRLLESNKKKVKLDVGKKIPPWLVPDDDEPVVSMEPSAPVIGPTINDLIKHVEKQKKKGLNPKRVGATFNHKAATSSNWLPSFGRVWNQGRRKQSRFQYESEKKKT